jgi:molecular chaperone Hsp33
MEVSSDDLGAEAPAVLEVRTYFVRGRNALLARAAFEPLYVDYYLHQGQIGIQHSPFQDELFKEALAAMTLHGASKPWSDVTAWTLHFQLPLVNLFVTADNQSGNITGQIFTDNVKDIGRNLMLADLARGGEAPRRSSVEFTARRPFGAVEEFYRCSEQRPARFFTHSEEDFVLIAAQPDCDLAWFQGLTDEAVRAIDSTETLSLLERRAYRWQCGCDLDRMMKVLSGPMKSDPEGLFGQEQIVRIQCPRCGQRYAVTQEAMEAFVAD